MELTIARIHIILKIEKVLPIVVSPNIALQKSNSDFGEGGYFFVFLIISNINITMILRIIRMIDNIWKSVIHIPPFIQISYVHKISLDTEGKLFPLKK